MKEEDIKRLIDKYYNGTSTEKEEMTLREYFKMNDIPEGYDAEKVIFGFYDEPVIIPEPSPDFESRILAGIDASQLRMGRNKLRRHILPFISAAAGLLILAGTYFFFIQRADYRDTFSDPELAYAETMKILMDVSIKLNHGTQNLQPVGKINEMTAKSFEAINKSTNVIEKNFKSLDYLQKAAEITGIDEYDDK